MEEEAEIFLSIIRVFFFFKKSISKSSSTTEGGGLAEAMANIMLEMMENSLTEVSNGEKRPLRKR